MGITDWIWDATTRIIGDTIALTNPRKAAEYRFTRKMYRRTYAAASNTGAYQLNKASYKSGQAEAEAAQRLVAARVRDLSRNNPIVAAMKLKRTTLVIGDEVGHKAGAVDQSGKPMREVNSQIEKRFARWSESAEIGGWSLTEAMQLIEDTLFDDGEVIVRIVGDDTASGNPTRIQILETDYLDTMKAQQGIEYNDYGKPVAYWLYNKHPGNTAIGTTPTKSTREKADGIFLLAETGRASQRRGVSPMASCVFKLFGVDDLEDAELVACRSVGAYGAIIETASPVWNPWSGEDNDEDPPEDDNGNDLEYLEAGGILQLKPGQKASAFKSERPNSNFDSFIRSRIRNCAGAAGVSYETASGDFSQVNFSSARMGNIVQWKLIQRRQKRITKLLNAIYRAWLKAETLLKIKGLTPAMFNSDPMRFEFCTWQLAGNEGIDPVKEANAIEKNMGMGLTSRTREAAKKGEVYSELAIEQAAEKQLQIELGIWGDDPTPSKSVSSTPEMEEETDKTSGTEQPNQGGAEDAQETKE